MAKLILNDLTNLSNETSSINSINDNSAYIETAIENTLSRDGTSPNEMESDLDMNSHRVLNLRAAVGPTEPLRKYEFDQALLGHVTSYPSPYLYAEDFSALNATPGTAGDLIFMLGYNEQGDGGEGFFTWNATSTEEANGGTVAGVATTGRWERIIDGNSISIRAWGGVPDGETDITPVLEAATAWCTPRGIELFFPIDNEDEIYPVLTPFYYITGYESSNDVPAPKFRGSGYPVPTFDIRTTNNQAGFNYDGGGNVFPVSAVSLALAASVTTSVPHGLTTGDLVAVSTRDGVDPNGASQILTGNGASSNIYEIAVLNANSFTIKNPSSHANINSLSWDAYVADLVIAHARLYSVQSQGYFKDMQIISTAETGDCCFFRGRALWHFRFENVYVLDFNTSGSGNVVTFHSVAQEGNGDEDSSCWIDFDNFRVTRAGGVCLNFKSSYNSGSFSYISLRNTHLSESYQGMYITGVQGLSVENSYFGLNEMGGLLIPRANGAGQQQIVIQCSEFQGNQGLPDLDIGVCRGLFMTNNQFTCNPDEEQTLGLRLGDGTNFVENFTILNTRWRIQATDPFTAITLTSTCRYGIIESPSTTILDQDVHTLFSIASAVTGVQVYRDGILSRLSHQETDEGTTPTFSPDLIEGSIAAFRFADNCTINSPTSYTTTYTKYWLGGESLSIVLTNSSGDSKTATFGLAYQMEDSTIDVAAGKTRSAQFMYVKTLDKWVQVGSWSLDM